MNEFSSASASLELLRNQQSWLTFNNLRWWGWCTRVHLFGKMWNFSIEKRNFQWIETFKWKFTAAISRHTHTYTQWWHVISQSWFRLNLVRCVGDQWGGISNWVGWRCTRGGWRWRGSRRRCHSWSVRRGLSSRSLKRQTTSLRHISTKQ